MSIDIGALIASALSDIPSRRRVLLFGSRVLGRHREGSDLDILVETDVHLDARQRRAIALRTLAEFGIAADVTTVTDAAKFIEFMVIEHYQEIEQCAMTS